MNQGQQNDDNVLAMPLPNNNGNVKGSSSTPSSVKPSSQGSLNGARPIALPTMTPKNQKKENEDVLAKPNANAVQGNIHITILRFYLFCCNFNFEISSGDLPVPEKLPEGVVNAEENEISNNIVDDRYKNKIEQSKAKKQEETDGENMANEDLDQQNLDEGLNFGDAIKHAEKQNFNKQHIDNLGAFKQSKNQQVAIGGGEYKEGQLEENPGNDEGEDGKLKV